jgi:hypothetical protein
MFLELECPESYRNCGFGMCLPTLQFCDGSSYDCRDNSDESKEKCAGTSINF